MGAAGPSAVEGVGKAADSSGDGAGGAVAVTVLDVAGSEDAANQECRSQAKDVCFMPVVSRLSLPATLSKCPRASPSVPGGLHADRWTRDEAAASSVVNCSRADAAYGPRAEAVHSASTTPSAPSSVVSSKLQSPDIREWRAPQADTLVASFAHGHLRNLRMASDDDGSVPELASDSDLLRLETVDLESSCRSSMEAAVAATAAETQQAVGEVATLLDKLDDAVYGAILAVREEADCSCNGESLPSTAEHDVAESTESLPHASCSDSSSDRLGADPRVADLQEMLLQASLSDTASERRPSCLASSSSSDERTERRRSVRFQTTPECVELQTQEHPQEMEAISDAGSAEVFCSFGAPDQDCAERTNAVAELDCDAFADSGCNSAEALRSPSSDDVLREFLNSPISGDILPCMYSTDVLRSPPLHRREGLSAESSTASLLRRSATAVASSTGGSEAEKAQFEVQFLVLQELLVEMEQAHRSPDAVGRQRTVGLALGQALHQLKPRNPEQVKLCEEFKEALAAFHIESSSPQQPMCRPLLPAPPPAPLPTPPAERRSLQATFVAEPDASQSFLGVTPLELPRLDSSNTDGFSQASWPHGSRSTIHSNVGQVDEAHDNCSADGEFSWEMSEVASSGPPTPAFAAREDSSKASVQDLNRLKAQAAAAARSASTSYSERLNLLKFVQEILGHVIEKPEEARQSGPDVCFENCAGADADAGAGAGISAAAASRPNTDMETLARAAFGNLWERGGAERCTLAGFNECSVAADGAASFRPLYCDEQPPSKTFDASWPKSFFRPERASEDFTEGRQSDTSPSNNSVLASPTFGGGIDDSADSTHGQWLQNDEKNAGPGSSWPAASVPSLVSTANLPQAAAQRAVPMLASGIDGLGGGTFSGLAAVTLESPTDDVGSSWTGMEPLKHWDKKVRDSAAEGSFPSIGRPAAVADAIAGAVSSGGLCRETPALISPVVLERPLAAWSVENVRSWAASLAPQLPVEIARILADHAINGQVLITLTESELWSIGITKFGWRRQLVLAVQELVRQQQELDTSQDGGEVASSVSRPASMASSPQLSTDSARRPPTAASPPAPPPPRVSPAASPAASPQQLTSSVVLHLPATLQAEHTAPPVVRHFSAGSTPASAPVNPDNRSSGGGSGFLASGGARTSSSSMLRRPEALPARRMSVRNLTPARGTSPAAVAMPAAGLEAARGRDVMAKREFAAALPPARPSPTVQKVAAVSRVAREPSPCRASSGAAPSRVAREPSPCRVQQRVAREPSPCRATNGPVQSRVAREPSPCRATNGPVQSRVAREASPSLGSSGPAQSRMANVEASPSLASSVPAQPRKAREASPCRAFSPAAQPRAAPETSPSLASSGAAQTQTACETSPSLAASGAAQTRTAHETSPSVASSEAAQTRSARETSPSVASSGATQPRAARELSPRRASSPSRRVGGPTPQRPPPSRSSPTPLPTFYCQLPRTEPLLQSAKRSPVRSQGRGSNPHRC